MLALHRAAKAGNLKMTMLLMDTGKVDINAESSEETNRVTALQEAANYGHNVGFHCIL
jgi:ankyrin repeat protein